MCGIIGYIGKNKAVPYLLEGLERLEYRGYDSAGIATTEKDRIETVKTKGRLSVLKSLVASQKQSQSTVGIGHTRWATHGEPSQVNSHPHLSSGGLFAVVHNGIIENYAVLKNELTEQGVIFNSETDTEVIAQLLEKHYNGDFTATVNKVAKMLEGSYALCILCRDFPKQIVCTRMGSPLVVGFGDEGIFVASDTLAMAGKIKALCRPEAGETVIVSKEKAEFFDFMGRKVLKEAVPVSVSHTDTQKDGYEHFMLKEIFEQPTAVENTLKEILDSDTISFPDFNLTEEKVKNLRSIYIVACGSAYHVGVCGKYVIEKLSGIPCHTDIASEFRYRSTPLKENDLCIIISQSGETADSIAAMKKAKEKGATVLSIVNVEGSTIATLSDYVIYTKAGAEIAVATTKAYSAQLSVIYCLGVYFADIMGAVDKTGIRELVEEIKGLPHKIAVTINATKKRAYELSEFFTKQEHAYFIGRGTDYAIAMEGSLKLKEISYIHSEAYGAGELKHGTISLIEPGTNVVSLMCDDDIFSKTQSNVKEVKARAARVFAVTTKKHEKDADSADYSIIIPDAHSLIVPSLAVIPLQLLSYYTALKRKCDIDKPRNLAKSVTVE